MYNHLAPEYLSSLIPQQVNDISRYNLRISNNIQTIRAKTNQYNNSFLPSVLRDWNTLPAETKQLNTLSSFKYFLKKDNKPVPKYYYYGKRKTQILHTRLRTGCSSLNRDLFLKNITDSPLCNCGSIENVQHYFFHCRFFQHQRTLLLNDIRLYRTPTLNLLLYGDPLLSNEINQSIFHHVHKYILATQRF